MSPWKPSPDVRLRRTGLAAVLVLALAAGCATSRRAALREAALENPAGQFLLEYAPTDAEDALRLQRALENAAPQLARWGALREPVHVRLLSSHAELEAAAKQSDVPWLRAWSRYDVILVQAPRTWSLVGATQPQIDELVLHELTHCLMYQLASDRLGWTRKHIPLWFREGLASYTADQAYRWITLEELARYLERHPEADPVGDPLPLYKSESNLIYGAAHHAFSFLVRRYGEDAVRDILREMKRGGSFTEAFESAIGLAPDAFVRDFNRFVRWRGFRGGRLLPRGPELPRQGGGGPAVPRR